MSEHYHPGITGAAVPFDADPTSESSVSITAIGQFAHSYRYGSFTVPSLQHFTGALTWTLEDNLVFELPRPRPMPDNETGIMRFKATIATSQFEAELLSWRPTHLFVERESVSGFDVRGLEAHFSFPAAIASSYEQVGSMIHQMISGLMISLVEFGNTVSRRHESSFLLYDISLPALPSKRIRVKGRIRSVLRTTPSVSLSAEELLGLTDD